MENNQYNFQQQPGERTSSSSHSSDYYHNRDNNGEETAEKERIIRTMANFMALLADMSENTTPFDKHAGRYGTVHFETERSTSSASPSGMTTRKQSARKRRLPPPASPTTKIGDIATTSTPEREVPRSSQELSETMMLLPIGTSEDLDSDSSAPGLIDISPDIDFTFDNTHPLHQYPQHTQQTANDLTHEPVSQEERFCRSRSWAKQKLAAVIFSHPGSLRSFCVEAYQAAREQNLVTNHETNPHLDTQNNHELQIFEIPRSILCNSVLLSITSDTWSVCLDLTLDVSFATFRVTAMAMHASVCSVVNVWDGVTRSDPINFASRVFTRPFNVMGRTTEVVVSGIQSVATGVGSASSIALHRLSAKNRSPLSSGLAHGSQGNPRRLRSPTKKSVNAKLMRKLNNLNSAAPVVSYTELDDNNGGLSRHAKSRVQRMMHYDVSLRPFVATVKLQESFKKHSAQSGSFDNDDDAGSTASSPLDGPFMCTPQSFPPTPASRAHVLKRGSRFADDVVFLARDQLRVHDGLESSNERTREMAQALTHGKRLAVFDADDASAGIELSCGQHVATKVGPLLYCSLRSMVPILRNCFVYFEMTVLGRSGGVLQTGIATLSFGLSTKEMPTDTLVGAWKGSVGLCTTGQILISGQWCSAGPDPALNSFGDQETVGCLVCLDDSSAFETWDGVMITATVTFNINGRIISPHVPSLPITGFDQHPPASRQLNVPIGTAPPSFTLPLLVPAEEELYPTLTLHSPGTSVMCRFSAGDVVVRSRDSIGAPKNVPVYAVDGSLVFIGEE